MDPIVQTYDIPGLAIVKIDGRPNDIPVLEIVLKDEYKGDLNDLERANGLPAGVLFRGSNDAAYSSTELAKFIEVMYQWDFDRDGAYECDDILHAINLAFWQAPGTQEFHRPDGGIYTDTLMRIMPPQPDRHIMLSFGNLKPRIRLRHYLLALPVLAAILGLVQLQIKLLPWTRNSVVSVVGKSVGAFGLIQTIIGLITLEVLVHLLYHDKPHVKSTMSPRTYGFFNKAAVYEEQAFREGSERWNTRQRIISCFAFGALHMVNLWYPLATILPLSLGGGLFMWVYLRTYRRVPFRRSAVLESSITHRVYNKLVLLALGGFLIVVGVAFVGSMLVGGIVVLGTFGFVQVGGRLIDTRRNRRQILEPSKG